MTTLITGATGFVGSAVLRCLLHSGHEMQALVRPGSDRRNLAGLPVRCFEGDLTDPESLRKAMIGCDTLFHVAADYRLWTPDPEICYRTNVEGTRSIMDAALAARVKRIVYTSSVAVLGLPPDGSPGNESENVSIDQMTGHYKRSKYLAEQAVRAMVVERGLPAVIVNPSTPIGPRDVRPTPTGQMIREAARGRIPAYLDTGLNLVHVDDVAQGHLLAFERGVVGERYILGGENMALRDILTEIGRLTGRPAPRYRLSPNLVLPLAYVTEGWARITRREPLLTVAGVKLAKNRMFFSSEKARKHLGYTPRPALEALEDAVRWFREQG